RRNPLLIELVGFFLLDAVVTGNVESLAVIGLQVGIGWLGSKALKIRVEVVLGDDQRIRNMGVGIKAFRHEHVGAEIHRASPKLAKELALNLEVPDVFGVLWGREGRNFLIENDRHDLGRRCQRNLAWRGIEVAWRKVPVLAFAPIHRKLDRVAIGAMKGLVAVQDGLNVIFPGRNVPQIANWITEGGLVNDDRLAGAHRFHIHPEHHLSTGRFADLHAGFRGRVIGEKKKQAAVDGLLAASFRERDGEARLGLGGSHARQSKYKTSKTNECAVKRAQMCRHGVSLGPCRMQALYTKLPRLMPDFFSHSFGEASQTSVSSALMSFGGI